MRRKGIILCLAALLLFSACSSKEAEQTPSPSPQMQTVDSEEPIPMPSSDSSEQTDSPEPTKSPEPTAKPASSSNPAPVQLEPTPAPQPKETEEPVQTQCTLSVNCSSVLQHLDQLNVNKKEIIPQDGVIFSAQSIAFEEGESAFDVLKRVMKDNKIHMEFTKTPVYNSTYIEGIANLYEFDCGELSGWMYRVNGVYPNYSASKYILKPGDTVEFIYTCDLGRDIGGDGIDQRN